MYAVKKQFQKGPEMQVAQFAKRDLAEAFIQKNLTEDFRLNVSTKYRLYDDLDILIKEYTANDLAKESKSSASSQGTSHGQTFSPSPFNTAPRPGGLPHSSFKKPEEDEKKK